MPERAPPIRRILVTNDDGIHAPGLALLEEIARTFTEEVWVVAPESDQSGASHSLTLRRPLRLRHIGPRHFAVDGTPTDCVLLALQHVIPEPVDLVLSGVNQGGNLGEDVTYSGTVAAAMEGTLLGVRSIALSQVYEDPHPVEWGTARRFAPELIARLWAVDWGEGVLINVNFPARAPTQVRGVAVTRQGRRKIGDQLVERIDPRGEPYIWIGAARREEADVAGTDLWAVARGYVSVTPVRLDLTAEAALSHLRRALGLCEKETEPGGADASPGGGAAVDATGPGPTRDAARGGERRRTG